jgi:hypothetical protein
MQFSDGIAAQPATLARSLAAVSAAVAGLPRPGTGDVVALVGIGASEHIARSAAYQCSLDSGPDSPIYTTGYTATLQALGLLGEYWSGDGAGTGPPCPISRAGCSRTPAR